MKNGYFTCFRRVRILTQLLKPQKAPKGDKVVAEVISRDGGILDDLFHILGRDGVTEDGLPVIVAIGAVKGQKGIEFHPIKLGQAHRRPSRGNAKEDPPLTKPQQRLPGSVRQPAAVEIHQRAVDIKENDFNNIDEITKRNLRILINDDIEH
mgnify:CR=1 FL=1